MGWKMRKSRATKQQMQAVTNAVLAKANDWRFGDEVKFAKIYNVDKSTVQRIRKMYNIKLWHPKRIVELVKNNPNITIQEVVETTKLSLKALKAINRKYGLGLIKPSLSSRITPEVVNGKTFQEVKQMFGISDTYLCKLIQRKGLKIFCKRGVLCRSKQEK